MWSLLSSKVLEVKLLWRHNASPYFFQQHKLSFVDWTGTLWLICSHFRPFTLLLLLISSATQLPRGYANQKCGLICVNSGCFIRKPVLKRHFMHKSHVKSPAVQTAGLDSYPVLKLWGHTCGHARASDFGGSGLIWTAIEHGLSVRREVCDNKHLFINRG